jgi:hypothetical protein
MVSEISDRKQKILHRQASRFVFSGLLPGKTPLRVAVLRFLRISNMERSISSEPLPIDITKLMFPNSPFQGNRNIKRSTC